MKLIFASTILIGAAAKDQPGSPENATGLRGPRPQGERQALFGSGAGGGLGGGGGVFVDFFGGGGGVVTESLCGDACADSDACSSFLSLGAILDPTSVFERACDARCFPKSTLSACERVCDEEHAETEAVVSTAVARAGFLLDPESAKESMCADCKFYECCLGDDDEAAADSTGYDACKVHLADDVEGQVVGNSLLDEIVNSVTEAFEGLGEALGGGLEDVLDFDVTDALEAAEEGIVAVDADFDSVLSQIVNSFTEAMNGTVQALENIDVSTWDFDINDWGDGASWTGSDGTSGASVFGQVVGSFGCPATCAESGLCDSVLRGASDRAVLEDACNSRCLPAPGSCDEICGNVVNGPAFLAPIADMACKSCEFFRCCGEDGEVGGDDAAKFNACQAHLPDAADALSNIKWDGSGFQEWIDDMDWSGMADSLGTLQSLFDESMAKFDSFASGVTCNPDTCPISGLCEMNIDLASVDFDDVCSDDAFFRCGRGLEDMCANECDESKPWGSDGFAPFCSLCDIATCCSTSKEDGKTFRDCTSEALSELTDDLGGVVDSIGSADVDAPVEAILVEDSPSLSDVSPTGAPGDSSAVSSKNTSGSSVQDSLPESSESAIETPAGDAMSETIGTSTVTQVETTLPDPADSPFAPLEPNLVEANFAEVIRTDLPDSGSNALQVLVPAALASLVALFFASL
eukprot:CAMPEP_0172565538 /NCGR_PEP_ID=MMETSP1067-20121228/108553_1 /TAXON_ID=265564 ORGANISM="Thalassiosira punctigera, Strain Tpunct2005C2" /NCGR_SAMPLE_ID=MMETSP1067 /ASSEMBLY_ACC=CAM_ASM_000444 /LENGTH=691 /DNA_ID=CAMNT_0013356433 /DNA_START=59 /DNA_END=2134 /DNA_ORIENTATION=-